MPKVSVIIPNYNHSNYLSQRIESVLAQSYQDYELLLLDDLSTDDSKLIIEKYRTHPRVSKIIYNEQNSGSTFKQWEKGISMAEGEYIWIAESDDWCEQNLLEELVNGIEKDPDCTISYCQSYCVEEENLINWQSSHPYLSEMLDGPLFIKKYLLTNNSIFNASMVLWKKKSFDAVSKEFLNYKFCGDWLFWIEVAQLGKIHISGKLLNYFRKHGKDVSGKANSSGLIFKESLEILNFLYQNALIADPEYKRAYKGHFKNYWKVRSELDPQYATQIKNVLKSPLSPKTNYYRTLLSAVWNKH